MSAVVISSRLRWPLLATLLVLAVLAGSWAHHQLLAASVFLRLEKARDPAWLVHYGERAVGVREYAWQGGSGRLYAPEGEPHARGIVLAHGMHEEGIDDARMVGFARSLAGAGFSVLTPRVEGLAHYRLVHDDVQRITSAADALARETQADQVIVFGISFGGGLAIRAACEGARSISKLVALGAHHDAERVARFYLGAKALDPDGVAAEVEPHPYGRVALFMSLFGERHRGTFTEPERARVLAGVEAQRDVLAGASPSACPGALRVPLFLVHGSGDRVVPYSETLWNARVFAPSVPVRTLISPAIVHAEYDPPTLRERLALIGFVSAALW